MRLLLAIGLFFLSLGLLLVGVAQRTILAPPPSHVASIEYDATNPYVIIPAEQLLTFDGVPTVTVSGAAQTFIATGRESDVRAWIGPASYTELAVEVDGEKSALAANSVVGATSYGNPNGSDLWRSSIAAKNSVSLRVTKDDANAVLIASDGYGSAPNTVLVEWPIAYDLTPSNTLLIIGGITLVAAFIMNLIALRDYRKRRGPRRKVPKAPQGPKLRRRPNQVITPQKGRRAARKVAVVTSLGLTLGLLSGCSANQAAPTPTATPTEGVVVDPPAVSEAQIARILKDVSVVAAKADKLKNRDFLTSRFSGPAYDMRAAHYFLQTKDRKIAALQKIASRPIALSLPAATSTWPRSFMAVTDQPGDALPQMIVMTQDNPRSQYTVRFVMGLMPGAKIPTVPAAELGAIPVARDSAYLKLPPLSIPAGYGDVIDKGFDSQFASVFNVTKDKFYQDISASQKAQIEKLTKGKISFKHSLGSPNVVCLSTNSGGALVAIYVRDTYTIRPVKSGSAVSVSGQEKLMLGSAGSTSGIRTVYGNMMLFYVPALSDDDRIRLIGVTSGLLSVKAL